jgi:hypothetical protein
MLLVFEFHWPVYHSQLHFIRNYYIPFFRGAFRFPIDYVLYGPAADTAEGVLSHGLPPNGHYSSHTLSVAIQDFPGYRGYIQLNDDSFVNPYLLNFHNFSRVLVQHYAVMPYGHPWVRMYAPNVRGIRNYDAAVKMVADICSTPKYNGSAICLLPKRHAYVGRADFFYIPKEYSRPYVELDAYCIKHWVFLEMCVPTLTEASRLSVAQNCRLPTEHNMGKCVHTHPVKYSSPWMRRHMRFLLRNIGRAARRGFYRTIRSQFIWPTSDDRPNLFVNDSYY